VATKLSLKIRRLGIDTYQETVVYMRHDCLVCQSEGFESQTRIRLSVGDTSIIATLNIVTSDILQLGEVGLSESAWELLDANEGAEAFFSHPRPLSSLSDVRRKIYGHQLDRQAIDGIISDVVERRYSDIHIAAFLTACAGGRLDRDEILALTTSMINHGDRLHWDAPLVVDKHCVGGLPGNRTSLIVVPIVASFGLTIPKTSSRAITSPSGTADTMEVLAPVNLTLAEIRHTVEKEGGCIVWGGGVSLSPADDQLIRVERALDLDSEGQLIASVLSKKIAAGSTHVLIDLPVGGTAKVRTLEMARILEHYLIQVGAELGIHVQTIITDGSQPVGRGIGPALEAKDVVAVLQGREDAPADLRERALQLAAGILEFSPTVERGKGYAIAKDILSSGKAWQKFQAICAAQGGMREPGIAAHQHVVCAETGGTVVTIDNRVIARIARTAGAPQAKTAGIYLPIMIGDQIEKNQPLFTIHAESEGELEYALTLMAEETPVIHLK
jgi:thymidine phosphorylase